MVRSSTRNRNAEAANREPAPITRAATGGTDAAASGTHGVAGTNTNAVSTMSERVRDDTEHAARTAQTAPPTSNVPAHTEQRALAPAGVARNVFESYGATMSISSITGTLIKFNKGDWVTGDDEDLDEGMELVANMDQLMVGWIKWIDNRPSEQIMGPVVEGYQPPRRNELGDQNQDEWETDDQGRARDPWQFSNYIVMKEPGQPATEDNLYTFATSSKGGLGAIGALCRTYGKEMRTRAGEYPIVKLDSDSYMHREYGRTKVPLLTVIGWEPAAQFEQTTTVTRTPAATPDRTPDRTPEAAPSPDRGTGRTNRRRTA